MILEFTRSNNSKVSIDSLSIESVSDLDNYSNRPEQTIIRTKSGEKIVVVDSYSTVIDKIDRT